MPPSHGLVHRDQLKWQDSNVEFINSSIDHRLKYASAATEPAWNNGLIGVQPGLFIWRIEQFQVLPWPRAKYGSFHTGDSYIILHSQMLRRRNAPPDTPPQLVHDIFFWLGAETSQDEMGVAAYKTVELDEFLCGAATQHRETQTSPSPAFLALFPRLSLLRGGAASGFRAVPTASQPAAQPITLLRVYTVHGSVLAQEVPPAVASLDAGDCFVADVNDKIWVWQGAQSSHMERAKAALVAADMREAKHADVEVVSQDEFRARKVLEALGDSADESPAYATPRAVADVQQSGPVRLLRLSDASGQITFAVVKEGERPTWEDLNGDDVFVLDTGSQLWVWQGQGASATERALWLRAAQAYLRSYRPTGLGGPIGKVVQGYESADFVQALA
ncbi:hypothetical protein TD95_001355 [Thielaviopsis punctulata]|uniref:Gelsolin-like domain-containing protein n=1 Tax=Thielaviopsis punctulata TaxID=72032 RepID=A0A0F4ZIK7_9PEZI|nr:hypothetical protein TD95_001355 [Thielaviopsis punctulata]